MTSAEQRRREAQKQKRLEREAAGKVGAEIVKQLRARCAAKERESRQDPDEEVATP